MHALALRSISISITRLSLMFCAIMCDTGKQSALRCSTTHLLDGWIHFEVYWGNDSSRKSTGETRS